MPILGGIDLLECKLEDNNHVGEVKQEIDMITRNANRLQKLAEDIVEVADIESSSFKIEIKMEDLCSMISNVICAMEKKYESDRKMISISFDSKNNIPNHDLLIACDADKIIQVLFHLLDNAMKFTERKINNDNNTNTRHRSSVWGATFTFSLPLYSSPNFASIKQK